PGDGEQFSTRSDSVSCSANTYRLYCFGIDYVAPLTMPPPPGPFKRVFSTNSTWGPVNGGSITDADNVCKKDAKTQGLCFDGATCPFIALLTPNGDTAQSRF